VIVFVDVAEHSRAVLGRFCLAIARKCFAFVFPEGSSATDFVADVTDVMDVTDRKKKNQ